MIATLFTVRVCFFSKAAYSSLPACFTVISVEPAALIVTLPSASISATLGLLELNVNVVRPDVASGVTFTLKEASP